MFGGRSNLGLAFKLVPTSGGWTESILHEFAGGADGAKPEGNLVLNPAKNIFGITQAGGKVSVGTVFRIIP